MSTLQRRIITILGSLILLAVVGIGGYLFYQQYGFLSPDPSITPQRVRLTNVTDTGFAVSWTTTAATSGQVLYGPTQEVTLTKAPDLAPTGASAQGSKTHHVSITNLEANTPYFFVISSNETEFKEDGAAYEVTTAPTLSTPASSYVLTGSVYTPDGQPATGALIYATILDTYPQSAQVKADGSWLLSLAAARNAQLSGFAPIDPKKTLLSLLIQSDSLQSTVTTQIANANPVPKVTLGENYDLEALTADQALQPAAAAIVDTGALGTLGSLTAPEIFLQDYGSTASSSAEVTILNPAKDYEELYTTRPQFLGIGPVSRVLSIRIAGVAATLTGTATVDSEGRWAYTPTQAMALGTYTLELNFTDKQGKSQTLTRPFLVSDGTGLGGDALPAFVSTPSATATPSASTIPLTTMPSTGSGVPVSGVATPTHVVLLLGLVLLAGGMYVKARYSST